MKRHPPGIARHRDGWRIYVTVGTAYRSRCFGPEKKEEELPAERDILKGELQAELAGRAPEKETTNELLRDAARRYLEAVRAMPTYTERERDVGLWVAALGDRPKDKITPAEIRAMRDRWLTVGPKMVQRWAKKKTKDPKTGQLRKRRTWEPVEAPLSASVVNHRLRALENLYSVLGKDKHAPNPVRQVPEADESAGPPRALPLEVVRAILDALEASKVKARLEALAWAGVPYKTLERMDATMVHPATCSAWLPPRRKGKGAKGREVPLTAEGLAALQSVIREDAFAGANRDRSNARRAFRLACGQVMKDWAEKGVEGLDLTRCTPYALRHSIAALVYHKTGDIKSVQGLLNVSQKTGERYAAAAIDPRLAAAVAQLDRAQRPPAPEPRKSLRRGGRNLRTILRSAEKARKTS